MGLTGDHSLLKISSGKAIYARYFHPDSRHMNDMKDTACYHIYQSQPLHQYIQLWRVIITLVKASLRHLVICQDKDTPIV